MRVNQSKACRVLARPHRVMSHRSCLAVAMAVLVLSCAVGMVYGAECSTDADCRPNTCCHSALCVAATSAPACGATQCSSDCQPFTLDCGGKCFCSETGKCSAILSNVGSPVSYSGGGAAGGSTDKKKKYTYGYQRVKRG